MNAPDSIQEITRTVRALRAAGERASVRGTGSKAFLGRAEPPGLAVIDATTARGILDYDPGDLVVTARAGTPLAAVDRELANQGQRLGFEPPRFGGGGTLGGAIASGLSGPVRPYAGAARDFVLGVEFVNGRGELIRAGGRVIKNVAGYDLARLMAGSLGTLGVITQLSLRVVPLAETSCTLVAPVALAEVPAWMAERGRQPYPISALAWLQGEVRIRYSGTAAGVAAAADASGLAKDSDGEAFWQGLRDHTLAFFAADGPPLWRLSHRPAAPVASLPGDWLIDWGGAQRWYRGAADAEQIRHAAKAQGGHATLFRGGDRSGDVFQRPEGALMRLQQQVKHALDPAGVFNPGRLYDGL